MRSMSAPSRGGPGAGKTAIAITFFCRGVEGGEPSVLATFGESPKALIRHAEGLGFPLSEHIEAGRARVLDMHPNRADIVAGEVVELTAVLARMGHALQAIGTSRLVIGAVDGMDKSLGPHATLRAELNRVFDWIREQEVTSLITCGEPTDFSARFGLEDYIADCVILLKQELENRRMTRLLRVLKRRGGR